MRVYHVGIYICAGNQMCDGSFSQSLIIATIVLGVLLFVAIVATVALLMLVHNQRKVSKHGDIREAPAANQQYDSVPSNSRSRYEDGSALTDEREATNYEQL